MRRDAGEKACEKMRGEVWSSNDAIRHNGMEKDYWIFLYYDWGSTIHRGNRSRKKELELDLSVGSIKGCGNPGKAPEPTNVQSP